MQRYPLVHPAMIKNRLFDPIHTSPIKFDVGMILSIIISVVTVLIISFYFKIKYQERNDRILQHHKHIYKYKYS